MTGLSSSNEQLTDSQSEKGLQRTQLLGPFYFCILSLGSPVLAVRFLKAPSERSSSPMAEYTWLSSADQRSLAVSFTQGASFYYWHYCSNCICFLPLHATLTPFSLLVSQQICNFCSSFHVNVFFSDLNCVFNLGCQRNFSLIFSFFLKQMVKW